MRRGFTLAEVLIVAVIMAVIAAIAIPNFAKTKAKNDAKQAIAYLRAVSLAEKMYYAKNGVYLACASAAVIQASLGPEIVGSPYTFVVTLVANFPVAGAVPPEPVTKPGFTITATGNGATIILDIDGNWTGTYTPSPVET